MGRTWKPKRRAPTGAGTPRYIDIMAAFCIRTGQITGKYESLLRTMDLESPSWHRDYMQVAEQLHAHVQLLLSIHPPESLRDGHDRLTKVLRTLSDKIRESALVLHHDPIDAEAAKVVMQAVTAASKNATEVVAALRVRMDQVAEATDVVLRESPRLQA